MVRGILVKILEAFFPKTFSTCFSGTILITKSRYSYGSERPVTAEEDFIPTRCIHEAVAKFIHSEGFAAHLLRVGVRPWRRPKAE
ncbi:MAG: hypothetical protein ACLQBC_15155 [Syntrophales bacterium]